MFEGNCHCGAFRFELGDGADLSLARQCACALCVKNGSLWLMLTAEIRFGVPRDDGKLTTYRFDGGEVVEFCGVCGTAVKSEHTSGSLAGKSLVNVRTLRGVNVFDLEPRPRSRSTQNAHFDTPLSGSCHCGQVTVQLLQPLSELQVKEDNCSICSRNAWIGIYPSRSRVILTGIDNTTEYRFGRQFNGFPFCKTCGVHVYQNLYGPPHNVVEKMPEARKEFVRKMLDVKPVNVRCLEGVSVDGLKVEREDEGAKGYEESVLGSESG